MRRSAPPPLNELPDFDLSRLTEYTRPHFENVLARITEVGDSMVAGYRPEGSQARIVCGYKDSHCFNAGAWPEGKNFRVGLSAAVIPLLSMLFWALLCDPEVLPQLPKPPAKITAKLSFRTEAQRPDRVREVRLNLNDERSAAAHVLADLCVSFVYLHELGHVICGHAVAVRHFMGSAAITEYARPRRGTAAYSAMRHYWEYQADSIAAALMPQYLDILLKEASGKHPWLRLLPGRSGDRLLKAHLCALVNAALSAMFVYLEGNRLVFRIDPCHPHPVARSLYVKDRLTSEMTRRWQLGARTIPRLTFSYLEPFLFRLEQLGLGSVRDWDPDLLAQMGLEGARLAAEGRRHRQSTKRWSWLNVDEWG